jgi:hypothetical protein|tara:strand:+ start:276 stop:869 length:594 start_codon:yes stop_codon:yes gene_type:complete
MWNSLVDPGSFPTIFTRSNNSNKVPGICIRWQWVSTGGFDESLKDVLSGMEMEIEETYYTCLDITSKYYNCIPGGIRIFKEDRELLENNRYKIFGSSLGLPFLLGVMSYANNTPWPNKTVSWGNIRPVRNNSFAIYPVDNILDKIKILRDLGAENLIHPKDEELNLKDIRDTGIPFEIETAVTILEKNLSTGVVDVY